MRILHASLCTLWLLGCNAPSTPSGSNPRLVSISITPSPIARDRVARRPTVTLRFDRPLAPPDHESLWLLAGNEPHTLRTEALHAMLSSTNAAHRIAATVAWDASDPTAVSITPLDALLPDAPFVMASTSRLLSSDLGAAAVDDPDAGGGGPVIRAYRVAPPRQCPPLARLEFPASTQTPRVLDHLRIGFDRPVTAMDTPPAAIVDPSGALVPGDARMDCVDADGNAWCVRIEPTRLLAPQAHHVVQLGTLQDDAGLTPQAIDLAFDTVDDLAPAPPPTILPIDCAADEIARPPFCLRIDARQLMLRATTDGLGAVRARALDREAESDAGGSHLVRLDGLAADTDVAISTWAVALDGALSEPRTLPLITTAPALPHLRITEVLLHPFSSSAQQFVEVLNDDDMPVSTDGLAIANLHGSTPLPDAVIPPHARAIIVPAAYDPRGVPERGDPPVAPGTVVITMPSGLGPHGLAQSGADVWIVDGDGHTLTRAPSGDSRMRPRRGESLVRADPRMREDDLASWAYDSGGGSTPGAPDSLR